MKQQPISLSEKIPPHDDDAEEAVIGALLVDGDCIHDLVSILKSEDFFTSECQWLYDACLKIMGRGEAINQITVARELSSIGKLVDIGGASHLSQLIAQCPTSAGVDDYARIVKNTSVARKAIKAGYHIQLVAQNETNPVKIVSEMERVVLEVQREVAMPRLITPEDLAERGIGRYGDLRQGKRKGIYTGYEELDNAMGGLFGGELCYIASRPGLGKTTILLKMAEYAGLHHGAVFMGSLEQPWADILDRMVGSELGLSPRKIRAGNYSDDLFGQIINYMGIVADSNLHFYDTSGDIDGRGTTTQSIYSLALHMKFAYGLSAVFIDYLGLIDDEKRESNYERVTFISRKLKRLAIDLDVPVICACQLNREPEKRADHRPQLSDLRDSGAIEQDADTVLFLYRDDYYEDMLNKAFEDGKEVKGRAEIIIGKQRQGGEVAGVAVPIFWDSVKRCYYGHERKVTTAEQFR